MKWPWVSRADYDRLQVLRERDSETLREERARYDALFEKYHALRVEGANIPLPAAPKAEPSAVMQAIIAKSGRGANARILRKHYEDYVNLQRAANIPEEEIAAAIRAGEDATEWGVPG